MLGFLVPGFERDLRARAQQGTDPSGAPVFDAPAPASDHDDDANPVRVNPFPMLSYVDSAETAPPMPTSLDPNAPRKVPGMGGTKQSPDTIHHARINRKDAEKLLTAKETDTRGEGAVRALELLNDIPAEQRGEVIDNLDDKAFENLLSRVPPDERDRFTLLVESSKNPARKLRMWKESHLSKARNAVNARKKDVGEDDLQTEYDRHKLYSTLGHNDQIEADQQWEKKHKKQLDKPTDDDGNPLPDKKRTSAQQANLKAHQADVQRASHTKEEVDHEVAQLMPRGKGADLTLEQVDAMIARKEREYAIETTRDIDLSATIVHGKDAHLSKIWSAKDLETIERTLSRLPAHHHAGRDRLAEIHRSNDSSVNGRWHDDAKRLEIANGALTGADQVRPKINGGYVGTDQAMVSQLELTLTHELGHTATYANPAAFEKFKAAAGWQEVTGDALTHDGVAANDVARLGKERPDPTGHHSFAWGKRKTYSPNNTPDTMEKTPYWGVDQSAIPGGSEWNYARVNPKEHFAEAYEMAVHDPKKFYEQHVKEPAEDAKRQRDRVVRLKGQLAALPAGSPDHAELKKQLDRQVQRAEEADRAVRQRGEQFDVMRDDVFGGGTATKEATGRLRKREVDPKRVSEFEARAAELSTPEQIRALEEKYR